jgi:hypothetical protein
VDVPKAFLRNAPWVSIAILLHVLLITVMSVFYFTSNGVGKKEEPLLLSAVRGTTSAPAPIEELQPLLDRSAIPVLTPEEEGPTIAEENYVPDAAPGFKGEITDETDVTKEAGHFNPDPDALTTLPSGATGATPIGVGKEGHYGNETSPYASRKLGGGGRGVGGPGGPGGNGQGGTYTKPDVAVLAALAWLKAHQSPDGHWDADAFSTMCVKNTCDGPGNSVHDVGVTGLALLCFLGAGYTHADESGPFVSTVKNGLKYLLEAQDQDGCFGPRSGTQFLYNHACAALAMTEAYGMTQAKVLHDPAQRGIWFIQRAQNPYGAWRYAYPPDGDNDTSVTGWMVMVLKSGKLSQLEVDSSAIENALTWIEQMTDTNTGRTGYTSTGGLPSRISTRMQAFPAERSEAMTAVGVLCRIFAGHTLKGDPAIDKGAELLARTLPTWRTDTGDLDFYYWYYGTLAMHQVGGPRWSAERSDESGDPRPPATGSERGRVRVLGPARRLVDRGRTGVLDGAQLPLHGGLSPLSPRVRYVGARLAIVLGGSPRPAPRRRWAGGTIDSRPC